MVHIKKFHTCYIYILNKLSKNMYYQRFNHDFFYITLSVVTHGLLYYRNIVGHGLPVDV